MSWSEMDLTLLGPAMATGLLVLATHVPLGIRVLSRGIVFIDLAIAQVAGVGVILADLAGWEPQGWGVQVAAVAAALFAALLLTYTDRRWPQVQEALIGSLFVLAATGAILLLAHNPHGGEHLKDLLVGQILWVGYDQLLPILAFTALLLLWWMAGGLNGGRLRFYLVFAVAVTLSVQLVGVYLVFASLIIPALASRALEGRRRLIAAYLTGAAGYASGLVLSAWFDLPSGAVIVWCMALIGLGVMVGMRTAVTTGSAAGKKIAKD